jgi:hypothetical protein
MYQHLLIFALKTQFLSVASVRSLADADAEDADDQIGHSLWELISRALSSTIKKESAVSTIGEILVISTMEIF